MKAIAVSLFILFVLGAPAAAVDRHTTILVDFEFVGLADLFDEDDVDSIMEDIFRELWEVDQIDLVRRDDVLYELEEIAAETEDERCRNKACRHRLARELEAEWLITGTVYRQAGGGYRVSLFLTGLDFDGEAAPAEQELKKRDFQYFIEEDEIEAAVTAEAKALFRNNPFPAYGGQRPSGSGRVRSGWGRSR